MLSVLTVFADLRILLQLSLHVEKATIPCHSEIGFGAEFQAEIYKLLKVFVVAVVAEERIFLEGVDEVLKLEKVVFPLAYYTRLVPLERHKVIHFKQVVTELRKAQPESVYVLL
jgi:hypothetical protein